MPLDVIQAADHAVWGLLTGDVELQGIMSSSQYTFVGTAQVGVYGDAATVADRLHLVMAPPDPEMPYLVRRWVTAPDGVMYNAQLLLDIWDYGPTATRVYSLRRRITQLLQRQILQVTTGETGDVRFYLLRSDQVPTDAYQVWHWETVWKVRLFPTGEV